MVVVEVQGMLALLAVDVVELAIVVGVVEDVVVVVLATLVVEVIVAVDVFDAVEVVVVLVEVVLAVLSPATAFCWTEKRGEEGKIWHPVCGSKEREREIDTSIPKGKNSRRMCRQECAPLPTYIHTAENIHANIRYFEYTQLRDAHTNQHGWPCTPSTDN